MKNAISSIRKYMFYVVTYLFVISFTFLNPIEIFAYENLESVDNELKEEAETKLNAGELIFDHILDSYDWHICTWKGKHVSVYLPVILYSEGEWYSFSSKEFHHHNQYHTKLLKKAPIKFAKLLFCRLP